MKKKKKIHYLQTTEMRKIEKSAEKAPGATLDHASLSF